MRISNFVINENTGKFEILAQTNSLKNSKEVKEKLEIKDNSCICI